MARQDELNRLKAELNISPTEEGYEGNYKNIEFDVRTSKKLYICRELPVRLNRSLSGLLIDIKKYIDGTNNKKIC